MRASSHLILTTGLYIKIYWFLPYNDKGIEAGELGMVTQVTPVLGQDFSKPVACRPKQQLLKQPSITVKSLLV